jgi:hypothetical protein
MRQECGFELTGPQPEDYIAEIKKWLKDGRTRSRGPFSVMQFNDPWSLVVDYPSTSECCDSAGVPCEAPPSVAAASREVSDEADSTDESEGEEGPHIPLLDLRIDDAYMLSVVEEVSNEDSYERLDNLDIFRADSATVLKEVLADYGIDLYCPVASIGDALPKAT